MDGTVDELVRLEEEKRRALIGLDAGGYELAVGAQTQLMPQLLTLDGTGDLSKLKAFARLADLNSQLYENFLATTSLALSPGQRYSGDGRAEDPEDTLRTFSAKA